MRKGKMSVILALLMVVTMVFSACEPETVEVTKVVEKEVVVTQIVEVEGEETVIEVTKIVQEEVPVEVEVEVVVTATPETRPGMEKQGGTLVMGYYQEPELLNDLIRTQTVADIAGGFMERGLLEVSPTGEYGPDLALEVPTIQNGQVSEDGLTVVYNLKDDVLWSDGTPFTCTDVQFTWEARVHPESGAVSTAGYEDIEAVNCLDDYTVELQYSQFYAPYLSLFSVLLPRHATGDPANMQNWVYNRFPISIGPFKLVEWVSGDHMTLERNERYEYWESDGKPYLDAIVLRFIESREVGKQLIQTGELDFLWDLIEADLPEAEGWDGVKISNPASTGTERLLLNTADPELDAPCREALEGNALPHWALGDPLVREAIELGIDKEEITEKLLFGYAPVGTTELNLGWGAPTIPPSEFNPTRAMELLEEAGWTDEDNDGIRECNGCPYAEDGRVLRLKIQTTSGNALREQAEQVIMEMLAEIGIELYIENVPSSELFGSYSAGAFRKHGQFDILMYTTSYGVDPHSQMFGYYGPDSIPCDDNGGTGYNYSRWIGEGVDEQLEIAASSPDLEVRKAAYQAISETIAEGRPHIYLYDRADIDLLVEDFMGYDMNIWTQLSWNSADWWLDR